MKASLALVFSAVAGAIAVSAPAASQTDPCPPQSSQCSQSPTPSPDGPSPGGGSGQRILNLSGSNDRVRDGVTIVESSSVYTRHPAPTCSYQATDLVDVRYAYELDEEGNIALDEDGVPIVDEARGPVTDEEIAAEGLITIERTDIVSRSGEDGRYVYLPIEIDWDNLTEDYEPIITEITTTFGESYTDIAPSVRARYAPLDRQMRRLWIRCEDPVTGRLDGSQYPDAIEVSILDPMWEADLILARLERELVFEEPTIVPDAVHERWGGLVVRSPAWLSIPAEDWQVRSTRVIEHRTNTFAMFGYPTLLQFDVDFEPHPDEPGDPGVDIRTAYDGTVDCLSSATFEAGLASGDGTMPARLPLSVLDDFSAVVGEIGPCTWVPPMRGTVTISGRTEYAIISLLNGQTFNRQDRFHDFEVTWQVGELRAVNVNDVDS
ncbi:MAG: hypothetical protein AAGF91_11120 [Actinomycetota bacterium]